MNSQVTKYLSRYSTDPAKIDRILVSAFLRNNSIHSIKNDFLKRFYILEEDSDFNALISFLEIFKEVEIENLIEAFEFVISPSDKIVTGAVYTPKFIRDYIIKQSLLSNTDPWNITICDPACGCAGFLLSAVVELKKRTGKTYSKLFSENIFGIDIQEYSVQRSKLLLSILAVLNKEDKKHFNFNFFKGNALEFKWSPIIPNFHGFDVVIGNPPYVSSRNLDTYSKSLLSNWEVCSTGHPDLYIPFFEIGLTWLKLNGFLGYITMNTFFKSQNGKALRTKLARERPILKIIDFGGAQVFKSKSTYTCVCLFRKQESKFIEYTKIDEPTCISKKTLSYQKISYSSLVAQKGWNLYNRILVEKIEKTGKPLGSLYKIRNGIATLRNNIFVFYPIDETKNVYYLTDESNNKYAIEKSACKKIVNPNVLSNKKGFGKITGRVIFPYYYGPNGKALLYPEEEFSRLFPKTFSYLLSKKDKLALRDKGQKEYEEWFAYGRNQSLERFTHKLMFPHITPHTPHFIINSNPDLLFVNGISIISDSKEELIILKKILSSRLFWFYIVNSSKPYGSGYFSLSKNYIKTFGLACFNESEKQHLLKLKTSSGINKFLEKKYGIEDLINNL